jgi:hypothetical protein
MVIGIDFDGTCVKHGYPEQGSSIDGAVEVLKELVEAGHNLILFTMRSNHPYRGLDGNSETVDTKGLDDAVDWFSQNDIPLYGIQTNPTQHHWTTSPKAYFNLLIDDAALGCPLIKPLGEKPYVDWHRIREMLIELSIIKELIIE